MRTEKSYCRLCLGFCGMNVTIDDDDRIVELRGDRDNPFTQGYACVKGLEVPAALYGKKRHLRPLKRVGDKQVPIPLEQALDEIAERMKAIREEHGAQSLAFFRGTGSFGSSIAAFAFPGLPESIGAQLFSTMTIDQSAKWVTMDRLGSWEAGRQLFTESDVWMFAGSNPLVSVFSWHTPSQNPMKRIKEAKARGTKIIVVDPRSCELAKFADIHLQIYPGEDAAVAAGLIHIVLANGWEDKDFCAQHVDGLEQLRAEVAPFTPELVAARAGITAEQLIEAADLFAHQSRTGSVSTGTGVNMARFPNLAEHLYESLGVICGRFRREGDVLANPGVLYDNPPPRAQAKGPPRGFEQAPRSRVRGAVRLMGESATPTLPEEIMTPGPGQVRSLLISGANPINAIPDRDKVVEAFRKLELLVVIDPFETATTLMADYVLPPKFLYEHADMTLGAEAGSFFPIPYVQYTPPVVAPPAGSDLADEGYLAWALTKRMGGTLKVMGTEMNMETPPTDDDFFRIMAPNPAIPLEQVKQEARGGRIYPRAPKYVAPAGEDAGRFAVMPDDLAEEMRGFARTAAVPAAVEQQPAFGYRLIARRMREVSNTSCHDLPSARKRTPYNPLCMHPDDLAQLGMKSGARAHVISDNGRIPAIVKADSTLKRGVVSMTHGFSGTEEAHYPERGASLSPLISLTRNCEPLQAMPLMSGIPVRIELAN